jgi:FtsP/CotA-like multicopper oxidase with cupredoxin domain
MRPISNDPLDRDQPSVGLTFALPAVLIGLLGTLALVFALVVVMRQDDATSVTSGAPPTVVMLSEFSISPSTVDAVTGAGLDVMNHGNVQHNLAVEGTSSTTPPIDAGGTAHLDLSTLKPGDYTIVCLIAGHKEAGMKASMHLTVGASAAAAATGSMPGMDTSSSSMTPEQMDQAMHDSIAAFPAKTAGLGAQVLAPTLLPDGTKQFELTTAVTKWEVSHGKTVDAMTYIGTVPGPTLKVDPGDKVRVVLRNQLPESTSIHFHGLTTPNSMDGTTEVTQAPVKPGTDFVYEFTAQSTPAVGMYHSHHNAVKQVPDGLAGAFLVGEQPVPAGVTVSQEQIMILDDSGTIGYALNGKSFPATAPIAAGLGDWVELHYMNEGTQIHPMHLHGMAQVVIAKDGYPLANPQLEDTVTVAPGERFTVLVHATEPGVWVWHCHILPHAENDQGMFGMVTALVVK